MDGKLKRTWAQVLFRHWQLHSTHTLSCASGHRICLSEKCWNSRLDPPTRNVRRILTSAMSEFLGCLIVDVIGSMRQVVDSQIGSLLFSGFVPLGTAL